MNEREAILILSATPGISPMRLKKLVAHFGSAQKILALSEDDLLKAGLNAKLSEGIARFDRNYFLKKELELISKHNVELIFQPDPEYPDLLKEIADAPFVLYVKGEVSPASKTSIAIVGSRRASMYGITIAEKFALELAERGITVVSGLAKGIDTAAHRGALRAKGSTLAVLGSGLANIYPVENKKLFEMIAESGNGAVISEFPMTMPPVSYNFPQRNRIISGLSVGVVVVEASAKSGALITSDFALEQGREVFAIPGKIDSPSAIGVNNLIKQGAKLVSSVEDILEEFSLAAGPTPSKKNSKESICTNRFVEDNLTQDEERLFALLSKAPKHVDQIVNDCGRSVSQAMSGLLHLELKGLIKQLPGKFFVRQT